MKIRTQFIATNTVIIAVALTCVITMCLSEFRSVLGEQAIESQEARIKTFRELLHRYGNEFTISDGKLLIGNHVLNGDYTVPDKLKDLAGGTATIFMNDERVPQMWLRMMAAVPSEQNFKARLMIRSLKKAAPIGVKRKSWGRSTSPPMTRSRTLREKLSVRSIPELKRVFSLALMKNYKSRLSF